MTLSASKRTAERLAANRGADLPPPKPPRPHRVSLDEWLCRAGWMSRCRLIDGVEVFDYWQAATTQASAGVAESYAEARRLALARLDTAAPRQS